MIVNKRKSLVFFLNVIIIGVFFKAIWASLISGAVVNGIVYISLGISVVFCLHGREVAGKLRRNKQLFSVIFALLAILSALYIKAFVSPPTGVSRFYSTLSYLQFIYPLLFFVIGLLAPLSTIYSIKRRVEAISFLLVVIACIEAVLPPTPRLGAASFFLEQKTSFSAVSAYYVREFNIDMLRVGSLFFEPLTYSMIAFMYFVVKLRDRSKVWLKVFAFLGVTISLVKSAIGASFIVVGTMIFGAIFSIVPMASVAYMIINIYDSLSAEMLADELTSVGNHVSGLVLGILAAWKAPFIGHGVGSAGYLIYLQTKIENITGPFFGATQFHNGNESVIGVAAYQFGYVFTALYVYLYVLVAIKFFAKKDRVMGGFCIAFIMFLLLSESGLSLVLGFVAPLLFAFYLRINSDEGRDFKENRK